MYPHQAERLDAALGRLRVDALVAASAANVAYVTGFRGRAREIDPATEIFAVYALAGTALVIPTVEAPALAASDAAAEHVVCYGRFHFALADRADALARRAASLVAAPAASAAEALARALAALGLTRGAVGLDDSALTQTGARGISERLPGFTLASATDALAEARLVKGPYEIDCLQQSLRIAEESIHEVLGELKAGTTEREAAALYESALARREARPSRIIIAFGSNAALPASFPSERALRSGDVVRFDVGCVFKGHHGSVARVAVLGEPTPRQQAVHDAVDAGVDGALAAIRPGTTAAAVFDAATTAVRAAGLPEFQQHHAGHGIGLEPAERPWLTADERALELGTVLCIETAYYELGAAGVHVKETVLVARGGAAVMNRSNRGLIVLD